jgi:hypothetical protein
LICGGKFRTRIREKSLFKVAALLVGSQLVTLLLSRIMTFYLLLSVYERGDSVALAVQSGTVQFPASPAPFSTGLQDLVIRMLNLDWTFR